MDKACVPETRTMPMPERPGGVARATMVSAVFNGGGWGVRRHHLVRCGAAVDRRMYGAAPAGWPFRRGRRQLACPDRCPPIRCVAWSRCATPDGSHDVRG